MTAETERRFTSVAVEIRAGSTDKRTIGGYAAKFDRISQNLGGFVERIAPQAFSKSRGDGWPGVIARYNHDDNMLLGTIGGGTLRLSTDEVGLAYDVDLPAARADVFELVGRGDVRQSSFAFVPFEDEWGQSDQGFPMRTLLSVRLIDVAPVNLPAYEDTSVGLRELGGAVASLAKKFSADPSEVRSAVENGDLTRFFKRTDSAPAKHTDSPQAAMARFLSLKH